MVLLTLTSAHVRALTKAEEIAPDEYANLQTPSEPVLTEPKAGNPISHSQLIGLSKLLKAHAEDVIRSQREEKGDRESKDEEEAIPMTLNALLRGSKIYVPPPTPKKEPTPEFMALMARLRAEEEARAYERLLHPNPLARPETFSQRYGQASNQFSIGADGALEDDDITYAEVHRQVILIINVLVSIVACAVFIWVAARHWSVPKRLGLSMGGSGAVAIAEVAVYSGYVRRISEAKRLEKKKPEIKEIVQSWVLDSRSKGDIDISSASKEKVEDVVRYRKGKHR